jgi:ABC-type phosphate transport system substrate-binding protein
MRTSIASATFLLLGAGAVAVGAAEPGGNNLALTGSDTLFAVTQNIISTCDGQIHNGLAAAGNLAGTGITYLGGGSGVGAGNMDLGNQQLSPMSRSLKNSEYCNNGTIASQSTTNAIMVGVDGVSVLANAAQSCSQDLAKVSKTFSYTNAAGPQTYTLTSSLDVLRIVFAGTDHAGNYTGDFGCSGPIRKALVANWSALFNASCAAGKCDGSTSGVVTQPLGLSHAWRRSDLSGTTDAFVTLVNMGSRKIGNNPITAPGASSFTVNPFCNSIDANAATTTTACTTNAQCQTDSATFPNLFDGVCEKGFCRPGSLASLADYTDKDPIRIPCDSDPNTGNDTDTVCSADGTLGLVLTVLLPDVTGVTATDNYPTAFCDASNTCALSKTGDPTLACPRGGPLKLGQCYQPAIKNADGTFNFNCIAQSFNKCFGDKGVDGRAYNLPLKKKQGTQGAQYVGDSNGNLMTGSYFRMHMTAKSSYAPASAITCQQGDDTHQIGCLVVSDPCSIGYAGREADQVSTANQALSIDGILPRPDTNISSLLDAGVACSASNTTCPSGFTCNTQFSACYPTGEVVYPLARRLYVASLVGFGNLQGGEKQLGLCFGDNNLLTPAIQNNNFVTIPAGTGRTAGAQCLDYPEDDSANANVGFLPTCNGINGQVASAGGSNTNACATAAAPTIQH